MHVLHFLQNLQNNKEKDSDDYIPVPKYIPELLKKVTSKTNYHDHIFHLHRSADESLFVAEPGTERRDIYRTIEPIWVCTINAAPQKASEASPEGLITLDKSSQKILEKAQLSNLNLCRMSADSTTGACTILFSEGENKADPSSRTLVFGKDIRRLSTPMWWFRMKTNELHSFDWKNQVRLEAYEDFDSTLTLTDEAFPDPFTVTLKKKRNQKTSTETEWQGFMYLNTIPRVGVNDSDVNGINDVNYRDLCIQGIDDFPNFNNFVQVDELQEQKEEEIERKNHLNHTI
ncbi:unnamed protein product [Mucor hiemalis]